MTISFNHIPVGIRTPGQYIEFDNTRALSGLQAIPRRILVIGQRLAAGTVDELVPTPITSAIQAETAFGRGSMLASMFVALKAANRFAETVGVALDDDDQGAQAEGELEFGGAATAAGTINLYVAGKRVRVGVAAGDDDEDVAAAVAAAITARGDLPVTAEVDGEDENIVNVAARHKGAAGNDIDLRVNYHAGEALPPGLTLDITAMSGGTSNPEIDAVWDAIGDEQYHDIVMPYTDAANLGALESELESRWGPLRMIEGHAYAAARGSHAALTTLGNSRNSHVLTIMGAGTSPMPPWEWASVAAAVASYHGAIDPARPFQTLELPGILPPVEADRFTLEERNLLLHDGISTFRTTRDGRVLIERLITTYQTNALDVPDASYLDVNTVMTVAYLRATLRARIALRYPRHKLADDGTNFGAGQAIVTPRIIRAEIVALFREWEAAGLAENIDQFMEDLIVERDQGDPNRINALVPPDIVNQLRVFAAAIQFRL